MNMNLPTHIHESNLIEGYDDPEFDKQSLIAWKYLLSPDLTEQVIKRTQKFIVASQEDLKPAWRGKYRKIDVWVGGHKGLSPEHIELAMKDWINSPDSTSPRRLHIAFEKIHPFVDGNGRTGRMLLWWMELKQGRMPTLILNSKKQDYYAWFKEKEES